MTDDDGTAEGTAAVAKTYQAPTLTRLGTLAELTLGDVDNGTDDAILGWNGGGPGSI